MSPLRTFWARQCTTLIQSFIVGSLFYMMPLSQCEQSLFLKNLETELLSFDH